MHRRILRFLYIKFTNEYVHTYTQLDSRGEFQCSISYLTKIILRHYSTRNPQSSSSKRSICASSSTGICLYPLLGLNLVVVDSNFEDNHSHAMPPRPMRNHGTDARVERTPEPPEYLEFPSGPGRRMVLYENRGLYAFGLDRKNALTL